MEETYFDILILGGGLAGGICFNELNKLGYNVGVIEKEDSLGGLLRSIQILDYQIDLGPHFFFHDRNDIQILNWVKSIDDKLVKMNPFAWNFPYSDITDPHHYPISTEQLKKSFPSITILHNNLNNCLNKDVSFEDYMLKIIDNQIYELYFKNYTEKFWGISPKNLSARWAPNKIRFSNHHEPFFGDLLCYRPLNGFNSFIDTLYRDVIHIKDKVVSARFDNDKLVSVIGEKRDYKAKYFINTIRPDIFISNEPLEVRGLFLIYVTLDSTFTIFKEDLVCWAYFPNNYSFTRLTDMKKACLLDSTAPTILCFEFPIASEYNNVYPFIEEVSNFLKKNYDISISEENITYMKINEQAPIPSFSNFIKINKLKQSIDRITNMICLGRFGKFEFMWMRDIISDSITAIKDININEDH